MIMWGDDLWPETTMHRAYFKTYEVAVAFWVEVNRVPVVDSDIGACPHAEGWEVWWEKFK